jgi:hypothetical protein
VRGNRWVHSPKSDERKRELPEKESLPISLPIPYLMLYMYDVEFAFFVELDTGIDQGRPSSYRII